MRVGTERVITAKVPESEKWVPELINEIDNNQSKFETSHKINNRWENSYLDIDLVPTVRIPMRFARDLGVKILEIKSVILFESLNPVVNPFPPFWFNIAGSKQFTGLHDHSSVAALSAVSYLQADLNSGNLVKLFYSHLTYGMVFDPTNQQQYAYPLPSICSHFP